MGTPIDETFHRAQDLQTITELLSCVSTDTFDTFVERALEAQQIPFPIFDCWEGFRAQVEASGFHLNDASLASLVSNLYERWRKALSFDNWFIPGAGDWFRFMPPAEVVRHDLWEEARRDFVDAVTQADQAFREFVKGVRGHLPELDIRGTNAAALGVSGMRNVNVDEPRMLRRRLDALIFRGGGVKALAFAGAVKELESFFHFDAFVGASAGGMAAVLLAAGYTADELAAALRALDFRSLLKPKWPRSWAGAPGCRTRRTLGMRVG